MMGGEAFVVIGQITRPHGLRGEVKVMPLTDYPERVESNKRFYLRYPGKGGEWKILERYRWQSKGLLMKFEGIDSLDAADALREVTVEISRDVCHELPAGEFYIADLIGLQVFTVSGQNLGPVVDVMQESMQDIYVIDVKGKDVLVPAVKTFIKEIDIRSGKMVIDPIEGLLD